MRNTGKTGAETTCGMCLRRGHTLGFKVGVRRVMNMLGSSHMLGTMCSRMLSSFSGKSVTGPDDSEQ